MKRITVLIYALICMSSALYPQSEQDHLKNIIPLSPNAASIARYGEIPVGHFTGVPNINIPIYTVKSGELTLPLSLNYHAGGNKVETIASWEVWDGVWGQYRQYQGLPDEVPTTAIINIFKKFDLK